MPNSRDFSVAERLANLPTLAEVRKELAEKRLADFVRLGWPQIDKAAFRANWHIDAICDHLEGVARGHIRNLMINIPPRHGKSLILSVAFPAWVWLQNPDPLYPLCGPQVGFFFASYSQQLSSKDGTKCKRLINSRWYREQWGERFHLSRDQNTKTRYENSEGGERFNTSVGGTGTGMGGDILAIDDAHNVKKVESDPVRQGVLDWWSETLQSRFNNPNIGAFIVQGQRVHAQDLCGFILENDAANWVQLCLPARFETDHPNRWPGDPRKEDGELLWPSHVGEDSMRKLQSAMTSYAINAQYQQRPEAREGGMFKREWFEQILEPNAVPHGVKWWRHWDLADTELKQFDKKGARTAGVLMGRAPDGRIIIADAIAKGVEGKAVKDLILTTAREDNANGQYVSISIGQDPGQAGKVQKSDYIELLEGFTVRVNTEVGDKIQRAEPYATQCEGKKVWLVRGLWNKEYIDEVCKFPGAKRKDLVDASSGAYFRLAIAKWAEPEGIPVAPRTYQREKTFVPGYERVGGR